MQKYTHRGLSIYYLKGSFPPTLLIVLAQVNLTEYPGSYIHDHDTVLATATLLKYIINLQWKKWTLL